MDKTLNELKVTIGKRKKFLTIGLLYAILPTTEQKPTGRNDGISNHKK